MRGATLPPLLKEKWAIGNTFMKGAFQSLLSDNNTQGSDKYLRLVGGSNQ